MRAVSSSFLAALVLAALFWGNCFSCPQLLLYLVSHDSAHSCCHRDGSQSRLACQSIGLKVFQKADVDAQSPAPPAVVAFVRQMVVSVPAACEPPAVARSQHSPPDLLTLNSTFRL